MEAKRKETREARPIKTRIRDLEDSERRRQKAVDGAQDDIDNAQADLVAAHDMLTKTQAAHKDTQDLLRDASKQFTDLREEQLRDESEDAVGTEDLQQVLQAARDRAEALEQDLVVA